MFLVAALGLGWVTAENDMAPGDRDAYRLGETEKVQGAEEIRGSGHGVTRSIRRNSIIKRG